MDGEAEGEGGIGKQNQDNVRLLRTETKGMKSDPSPLFNMSQSR